MLTAYGTRFGGIPWRHQAGHAIGDQGTIPAARTTSQLDADTRGSQEETSGASDDVCQLSRPRNSSNSGHLRDKKYLATDQAVQKDSAGASVNKPDVRGQCPSRAQNCTCHLGVRRLWSGSGLGLVTCPCLEEKCRPFPNGGLPKWPSALPTELCDPSKPTQGCKTPGILAQADLGAHTNPTTAFRPKVKKQTRRRSWPGSQSIGQKLGSLARTLCEPAAGRKTNFQHGLRTCQRT